MPESLRPSKKTARFTGFIGLCALLLGLQAVTTPIQAASEANSQGLSGHIAPIRIVDTTLGPSRPISTTQGPQIFLPQLQNSFRAPIPDFPDRPLAERIWRAAERFDAAWLNATVFPGDRPEAGGPGAANVAINIEAACHDFPDLEEPFGEGAHPQACRAWVSGERGLWFALRAERALAAGAEAEDPAVATDLDWARAYLDYLMDAIEPFLYGPEDLPEGAPSHRDTLAAVWQNPWRGVDLVLLADKLRSLGALDASAEARAAEQMSAIVRAWYGHYRVAEPPLPNTGRPFTTAAFPDLDIRSLAGRQVASRFSWTFEWDADKGNTQAEESSWSGAAAMQIARILGQRIPDAAALYEGGRRYVDFSLVYDRINPRDGQAIRSLNAETEGGAYGQRRYWLENHTADVPSIPYISYAWLAIGSALFASDAGPQAAWPSLAPSERDWEVMLLAAGETLRAPDGHLLVDFTPGGGIGYAMEGLDEWTMPCGRWRPGAHYVLYDGRAGGSPLYVSEIGHPAGLDIINLAWPIMQVARSRDDRASYEIWRQRLDLVLDEYGARPPSPYWTECNIAPYVSDNPGYQGQRMLSVYLMAYLGVQGYTIEPW
jgi:hypothetical protein